MTTTDLAISNSGTLDSNRTSLGTAALFAGLGLLIMVIAAPFAEIYVLPKLVIPDNGMATAQNIVQNQALFRSAIFANLITFVCDLLVAWALYILLKPVHEHLSLLTALFRLVYTVIALVALLNLVTVSRSLNTFDTRTVTQPDQLYAQVMLSINTFRSNWYFGLIFFGIHLGLLGYLVIRSKYIPKILGGLLIVAGAGYLLTSLKPFLFPTIHLDFAAYTFYGELIFMLWLLIRGPKIKEAN
jgi:hypothetical protein